MCLFETRISYDRADRADGVIAKIGFPNSFRVEAEFAGGIWFCWTDNIIVDILEVHFQMIHVRVRNAQRSASFLFSAVYASLQATSRRFLWDFFNLVAEHVDGSWLLAGDFNLILDSSDRVGDATTGRVGCRWFRDFLFLNGLRDLRACGARFTWCRGGLS